MRKSFPWEDLRHASDTFSFIKATGKECGSYTGEEHLELKKKKAQACFFLSVLLRERSC